MKKYSVVLIGLDANDTLALLHIKAEAEWIPLNAEHISKMENFRPQRVPELKLYEDTMQLFGWSFP